MGTSETLAFAVWGVGMLGLVVAVDALTCGSDNLESVFKLDTELNV